MAKRRRVDVGRETGNAENTRPNLYAVDVELVQRRAYEIYESRGCVDGAALDDWLQAEHELTSRDRDARHVP